MNAIYSHLGLFLIFSICAIAFLSWFYLGNVGIHKDGSAPTDSQIVRLLVILLAFATFNMVLFMWVIWGR